MSTDSANQALADAIARTLRDQRGPAAQSDPDLLAVLLPLTRAERHAYLNDPPTPVELATLNETDHIDHIETLRADLVTALEKAVLALRTVGQVRRKLIDEYDVEHAEGGHHFDRCLDAATRALENAELANPTRPDSRDTRLAKASLASIAGLMPACPAPARTPDGTRGACEHGYWPCAPTQVNWLANGLQPEWAKLQAMQATDLAAHDAAKEATLAQLDQEDDTDA